MDTKAYLHDVLTRLRDEGPPRCDRARGICYAVRNTAWDDRYDVDPNACTRMLEDLMATWPEHSGMADYPVPHPRTDAKAAYMNIVDLWADDDYGNARRRLLDYLIKQTRPDTD